MSGGTELMMGNPAPVALATKPSITPVTVPGVLPPKAGSLVKEKSKLSAWLGVDASANARERERAQSHIFHDPLPSGYAARRNNGAPATEVSTSIPARAFERMKAP
jgi:hypothetical protein